MTFLLYWLAAAAILTPVACAICAGNQYPTDDQPNHE